MLLHLFFVLFDNECVNTRERVVKKELCNLLISEKGILMVVGGKRNKRYCALSFFVVKN